MGFVTSEGGGCKSKKNKELQYFRLPFLLVHVTVIGKRTVKYLFVRLVEL